VAEGVTNLNEQMWRFWEETSREFRETQAMIRLLERERRLAVSGPAAGRRSPGLPEGRGRR
jgi:hypothetical protein